MANPRNASLPFTFLDKEGDHWVIRHYHAPSGIWRETGQPHEFATFEQAEAATRHYVAVLGGSVAVTREAFPELPKFGRRDG
ncbi:hypothetical protein GCM10011371_13120 [Novosphingobium marinum]|uniref:Uncharacterized protein n=1 Tax=Novosphingobium marinum TaxID=1514948 RepID=A0A7Z0BVJ5_9SPHN|nr:hypothetical protein [Novosphingobium marinum]NYH95420.1 hypothetical protein [Novosphingobium marinum]GGC26922.1 hypothetical protein GCM10011371_13120 [Novosphingobium marinum]